MAVQKARNRVTDPDLEQFVVANVRETGVEPLGTGAYGTVVEAEISLPRVKVAAKKLHPQLINLDSPQQEQRWVTKFVEECKLMSQLCHPHIVQFQGVCYLPESSIPVLLMEKLPTSLDNLLETTPNIPLSVKVHFLIGTCRGLVYLHNHTPKPIVHRDLTARNILIDSELTAKIADLGVARMVDIQPDQEAALMTACPGNNLHMPPEAIQGEEVAQYNTTIDIFSFGVVSLFTITQTFPKKLKPASYFDEQERIVKGRTEIERREEYVQQMITALGETHALVKLTLNCLDYLSNNRPSAEEVLRQLEEDRQTILQNCTGSKLELIRQIAKDNHDLITKKEEEHQQIQVEHQRQLTEKNEDIQQLQQHLAKKNIQIDEIQNTSKAHTDRLQTECSNQQKLIQVLEKKTTLQQQQLEEQRREIEQLRLLKFRPQEDRSKGPEDMASMNKVQDTTTSMNEIRINEEVKTKDIKTDDDEQKRGNPCPPPTLTTDLQLDTDYYDILVIGRTGIGKSSTVDKLMVPVANWQTLSSNQRHLTTHHSSCKNAVTTVDTIDQDVHVNEAGEIEHGNLRARILSVKDKDYKTTQKRLRNIADCRRASNPHEKINELRDIRHSPSVYESTRHCELLTNTDSKIRVLDAPGFFGSQLAEGATNPIDTNEAIARHITHIQAAENLKIKRILYFFPQTGPLTRADRVMQEEIRTMVKFFSKSFTKFIMLVGTMPEDLSKLTDMSSEEKFPKDLLTLSGRCFENTFHRELKERQEDTEELPVPPTIFIAMTDTCEEILEKIESAQMNGNDYLSEFHSRTCSKCGIDLLPLKAQQGDRDWVKTYLKEELLCHPLMQPQSTAIGKEVRKIFTGKHQSTEERYQCVNCGKKPGSHGCMDVNAHYAHKRQKIVVKHSSSVV